MTLHLEAGQLCEGSPEVWGCPRFSDHGAGWLFDWYDASGSLEGVTLATGEWVQWCEDLRAGGFLDTMQAEVEQWRKRTLTQ